jgi:hypothetical protein
MIPVVRRADLTAVLCEQFRHEQGQLERDIKDDTLGDHAEPPAGWNLARSLVRGAPRRSQEVRLCPPACPDERYAATVRLTLAKKTSVRCGTNSTYMQELFRFIHHRTVFLRKRCVGDIGRTSRLESGGSVTKQVTTTPGNRRRSATSSNVDIPTGLRQPDPMRCHQTKPRCMVRRRSTVRFRNGAPAQSTIFENNSNG